MKTDENNIPISRYFPVIDADDTGQRKIVLFPSLSDTAYRDDGKPYLEEISSYVFLYRNGADTGITPEISCPNCGKGMEYLKLHTNETAFICRNCLKGGQINE